MNYELRGTTLSGAKLRFFLQIHKFWSIFAKYLKKSKKCCSKSDR